VSNIDRAAIGAISVPRDGELGLAVSNMLAGVRNGSCQVEGAIQGLGERAGNAALEEVAMAIRTRRRPLRSAYRQ